MAEEAEFVKIVIDLPDAEDGVGGEGIWAKPLGDELYEVYNSPWHSTDINFHDVVRAIAPAEDKKPVVTEIVRRGGHRSIHVVFFEEGVPKKDEVLAAVNALGATYENANGRLYALDLKPHVNFDVVADYLQECLEKNWLDVRYAAQPQPKGTGDSIN